MTSMSKLEDLTGRQFERLTVIKRAEDYICPNGQRMTQWLCECSCEEHNIITVLATNLKQGRTRSCGCLQKERAKEVSQNNRKKNKYDISGSYGIGWSSNTNEEFYFDLEDYDKIKDYCWYVRIPNSNKSGRTEYHMLETWIDNKAMRFTEMIGCKHYDHIDRNPLNNRKENLRPCTQDDNTKNHSLYSTNKSGVSGVCYSKNKYMAYIYYNYKKIELGSFDNKNDAIIARLKAEKEYFGEFAPQQYLFEQYGI